MARTIQGPALIQAAGFPPKTIEEFVGRANTGTETVSIARMTSPCGWSEPGQTPEFDEYTLVLSGSVHVRTRENEFDIPAGQAFLAPAGEWVQYSTPAAGGAQYIAVCVPAFAPDKVHREQT